MLECAESLCLLEAGDAGQNHSLKAHRCSLIDLIRNAQAERAHESLGEPAQGLFLVQPLALRHVRIVQAADGQRRLRDVLLNADTAVVGENGALEHLARRCQGHAVRVRLVHLPLQKAFAAEPEVALPLTIFALDILRQGFAQDFAINREGYDIAGRMPFLHLDDMPSIRPDLHGPSLLEVLRGLPVNAANFSAEEVADVVVTLVAADHLPVL
mmetsp:Transcript_45034/g.114184  ORF Transcript_45034/g.114184 Transcript_45034/m.114184 type:complete len:213 (-) Transcript_45034:823-1461(-)